MTGAGDNACDPFEERLVAAQAPLTRALSNRGVGVERAEELAQEATVRALRSRARYDSGRDMLPWLLLIAWRVELDDRRRRRTAAGVRAVGGYVDHPEPADVDARIPGEAAILREATGRVGRAVAGLTEMRRQVVDLFYRDGRSISEIASQLSVADGTVKSHLHRAREQIASRLAGRELE